MFTQLTYGSDLCTYRAMENKSLNVFNTSCVLTDPVTSSDAEYYRVEGIIGHEYFHNWTGVRNEDIMMCLYICVFTTNINVWTCANEEPCDMQRLVSIDLERGTDGLQGSAIFRPNQQLFSCYSY